MDKYNKNGLKDFAMQELGFKKKWLSDSSGHWFELKKGKYFKYTVDFEFNQFDLELIIKDNFIVLKKFKTFKALLNSIDKSEIKF